MKNLIVFLAMTVGWAYALNHILQRWHNQEGIKIAEHYANAFDTRESDA